MDVSSLGGCECVRAEIGEIVLQTVHSLMLAGTKDVT